MRGWGCARISTGEQNTAFTGEGRIVATREKGEAHALFSLLAHSGNAPQNAIRLRKQNFALPLPAHLSRDQAPRMIHIHAHMHTMSDQPEVLVHTAL